VAAWDDRSVQAKTYGAVRVTWGANSWVLVDTSHGSTQRRVDRREELEGMLAEVGLLRGEVERVARTAWADRPAEARLPLPTASEPQYRTAGMRQGTYALVLVAGLASFVVLALYRF
jgi:hypothetical protein